VTVYAVHDIVDAQGHHWQCRVVSPTTPAGGSNP
jgi:hypothetical protein